jgi:ComEC/Rec2-related protein
MVTILFAALSVNQTISNTTQSTLDDTEFRITEQSYNQYTFTNQYTISSKNKSYIWRSADFFTPGILINASVEALHLYSTSDSFQRYLLSKGILGEITLDTSLILTRCDSVCTLISTKDSIANTFSRSLLNNVCYRWQDSISALYVTGDCEDIPVFMSNLIIQNDQTISDELDQSITSAGLAHIISVSGFQITIIAVVLESLMYRYISKSRTTVVVLFLVLFIYGLLAGFAPPILRALFSSMISITMLTFVGRKITSFHALLYSSLFLLILYPYFLLSYSFILSVLATLALIVTPLIEQKSIWSVILVSIQSTLFAFLFTFPISSQFGTAINPIALIFGAIVLVPLTPVISLLSLISAIPLLGEVVALLVSLMLILIFTILHELSITTASFEFEAMGLVDSILYYGIVIGCVYIIHQVFNKRLTLFRLITPFLRGKPNQNIEPN